MGQAACPALQNREVRNPPKSPNPKLLAAILLSAAGLFALRGSASLRSTQSFTCWPKRASSGEREARAQAAWLRRPTGIVGHAMYAYRVKGK